MDCSTIDLDREPAGPIARRGYKQPLRIEVCHNIAWLGDPTQHVLQAGWREAPENLVTMLLAVSEEIPHGGVRGKLGIQIAEPTFAVTLDGFPKSRTGGRQRLW